MKKVRSSFEEERGGGEDGEVDVVGNFGNRVGRGPGTGLMGLGVTGVVACCAGGRGGPWCRYPGRIWSQDRRGKGVTERVMGTEWEGGRWMNKQALIHSSLSLSHP